MDFVRQLFEDQRKKLLIDRLRQLECENKNLRKINTELVRHINEIKNEENDIKN